MGRHPGTEAALGEERVARVEGAWLPPRAAARRRRLAAAAVGVLSLVVLVLDLATPLGVAAGVGYASLPALGFLSRGRTSTLWLAAAATGLVLVGYALAPPAAERLGQGTPLAVVLANRALSIGAIWLVAGLVLQWLSDDRRFRAAFGASPSAMLLSDRDGRVLMANEHAHRLLGHESGGLVGRRVEELVPGHARERHADYRAAYFRDPRFLRLGYDREIHARRADGRLVPVEVGMNPIRLAGETFVLSSLVDVTEAREGTAQRERLAAIVRSSSEAILAKDLEGRVTDWNAGAEAIYGWKAEEIVGQPLARIVPADRREEMEGIMERVRAGRAVRELVTQRVTRDGRRIDVLLSVTPVLDGAGRIVGAASISRDVTAERRAESQLLETTLALANAMPGISRIDDAGRFERVNEDFARSLGRRSDELVGRRWSDGLPARLVAQVEEGMEEALRDGKAELELVVPAAAAPDGTERHLELLLVRRVDEAERPLGFHAFLRDVTQRRREERRYRELARELEMANLKLQGVAHADPLTGLLNRRGLEEVLRREVDRARREGSTCAALLLDLDEFKAINDDHGHVVGDEVLVEVARRLRGVARSSDSLARIGGDEFLVLLPSTRMAEARRVAERMRVAVGSERFEAGGAETRVRVSIGLAAVPDTSTSIASLLALTREALQRAKRGGKNRVGGGDDPAREDLLAILEGRGLRALQQPILDVREDRVVAHEMLARGPRGTLELPDDFLRASLAHDVGVQVDLHCLRACIEAARALPGERRVHVNLFPSTLLQAPLEEVGGVLDLLPSDRRVCVELNEHQLVGDPAALRDRVRLLREAGVQVAIDDVGFGRSSLEALIVLEPDLVKIDRRYVQGVAVDRIRRRALDRILSVTASLRTQAIAEGIESAEDLEAARSLGVSLAQGYLLGRPTEPDGVGAG